MEVLAERMLGNVGVADDLRQRCEAELPYVEINYVDVRKPKGRPKFVPFIYVSSMGPNCQGFGVFIKHMGELSAALHRLLEVAGW